MNDANRLTYITPSLAGFQVGASYVPDAIKDSVATIDQNATLFDGVTVAAKYTGEVGTIEVAASAAWGTMPAGGSTTDSDPTSYSFGLSLGYGQINVSATYAGAEDDPTVRDMSGFTVGAAYTPGPGKIALTGFSSERDGPATANTSGAGPREGSYDLGPGVSVVGVLGWVELQDDSGLGADDEAICGVTMVRLSFLSRRLSTGVGAVTSASPTPDSNPAETASINHRPSVNRARRRRRHTVTPSPRMTITTRAPAIDQDDD